MLSSSFRRSFPLAVLTLALFTITASAQVPTAERRLDGIVRHGETQAPLPNVAIIAGERRTVSGPDGRFTLRLPASVALLELTLAKFYPLATTIDLTTGDSPEVELLMVPRSGYASSVDVVGEPPPASAPSAVAVKPADVLQTPGALDNVFRTLQTLPGVSAAEEVGSRLSVRGGAPDQNLTVMDGVEIHDPYRLFGLTSAFNPETIGRFELATGGFSVKYGDRLSSLLVVENRDGTRAKAFDGSAALSITDANVVFEGALPGDAVGSWLVSGRRTYYDLVASRIVDQDFPRFADVQTKGVWQLAPGRTLSVFGLRSRQDAALNIDEDDARGEFNDNTSNDLVSVRFDAALGRTGQSHTVVSYSDSTSTFGVDAAFENRTERANTPGDAALDTANVQFERRLALRDLAVRQEVSWAFGNHLVETGGELHGLGTDLSYQITGDRNPTEVNGSSQRGGAGLPDSLLSTRDVTRSGLWLLDRWQARAALALEAGVRLDSSGTNGDLQVSPRLTAVYTAGPGTSVRAALGRYTQGPGYEKLVQSDYVLDLSGPEASSLRSEQAVQAALGIEQAVGSALFRVEGYYKASSRLLVGALESEQERLTRLSAYDFPASLAANLPTDAIITTAPTNDGRGRAYGFDIFVSRTSAPASARLRGWASYTWGRAERESYGRTYAFEYDRRHAFSAVASYRLSERWELATTTRVASGFPRTAPLGLRVVGTEDVLDGDGDGNSTELVPRTDAAGRFYYGVNFGGVQNLNNARLPVFARVDARATWRPRGARGRWEFYAEVINLLNRKNAGSLTPELDYDPESDRPLIVEKRDQGIPRLPTLGVRVRF